MSITASMVKELRERTGAGMMECKKALTEAGGDIEKAIEDMRKSGAAKAAKKAGRVAAEGVVVVKASDDGKTATIVEINSETDFAAKSEDFQGFVSTIASTVLTVKPADVEALNATEIDGGTVQTVRDALVAKIGENIQVRRFEILEGDVIGAYKHGERIGVLAVLDGGDAALGKDVAMHIAATNPEAIDEAGVAEEVIAKEKDIFTTQAKESGKPDEIIEKMIVGRMKKFMAEVTLVGQSFVKNPDVTVGQLLKDSGASCTRFVRFEVGEGIEKEEVDFAAEVAAQAAASQ